MKRMLPPLDLSLRAAASALEERLERGEILPFAPCPFALPTGPALAFLLEQRLKSSYQKNISYNPGSDTAAGFLLQSSDQAERLRGLLRDFSTAATTWLAGLLPRYASHWQRDRVSFRPEEEATRALRLTARNDLLHLDAFPSRPTRGYRILRLFANVNPTDERVWVASETFGRLLERFGTEVGLPAGAGENWARRLGQGLLELFQPVAQERTPYDSFMLRLHHFLKANAEFQERAPRRFHHFKPGTAWLAFTDTVSHAELRGQYALEHSFFIAPRSLALPEESPPALLEKACGLPVLPRAA
jgi:hypothetical protein